MYFYNTEEAMIMKTKYESNCLHYYCYDDDDDDDNNNNNNNNNPEIFT
jgi:hypothetical protein